MSNFHQTIIVGHLGRDPEIRYMPSGDAVCNFSVAVTESWKSKDGEKKEQTTWYRCNAFSRLAEVCGEFLKKGSAVMVIGRMTTRKWEKDGVERESWELRADSMKMLGSRTDSQEAKPAQERQSPGQAGKMEGKTDFDDLNEIPF